MAQKKDAAVSISARREMSVLLSQSREASARIRVENIIQTDICVELMEILELYAELLLARAGLLDARDAAAAAASPGVDTGLEEAAASIIYAAVRLPREVRELGVVRGLLVERFGKEFAVKCNVEGGGGVVPKRVVDKLRVEAPGNELVEAYLREIARTYGVVWPRVREGEDEEGAEREREREMGLLEGVVVDEAQAQQEEDSNNDKITTALSTPITPKPKPKAPNIGRPFSTDELSRATPPRDLTPKVPRVPSPSRRPPHAPTIPVRRLDYRVGRMYLLRRRRRRKREKGLEEWERMGQVGRYRMWMSWRSGFPC